MPIGDLNFYRQTLLSHAGLLQRIRREFEQVVPEIYHKEKRLPDGPDHDLDAAIEAITDLRIGVSPSEKIFWRHHKIERDVAVAFLLDMSGSTGEAIGSPVSSHSFAEIAATGERSHRRIIDVEKEAIVLMMDALEAIGDRYGVYGFSGHGRDNVEFYVIKDIGEEFTLDVAKRFGRVGPLHATRMGPAIRHAAAKLRTEQTRSKFLFDQRRPAAGPRLFAGRIGEGVRAPRHAHGAHRSAPRWNSSFLSDRGQRRKRLPENHDGRFQLRGPG